MEKLFHRIMCPIDLSDACIKALKRALELKTVFDTALYVSHIVTNPLSKVYGENPASKVAKMGVEKTVQEKMQAFLKEHFPGISFEILIKQATHAVHGIVEYAEEKNVDLIVVATHGNTERLKYLLLGSVAEAITRRAPCSVLVVRP